MLRGQAFTQAPHEVHFSSLTSGMPVSSLMVMAPNWQAASQSPHPRQPNPQPVSPAPHACMAAHERRPSYSAMRGRISQVPLHLTTATFASVLATAIPSKSATCPMTSAPPTGQASPSMEPASAALTSAAANPLQPGNPQPPQLAPGNASVTCPNLGSSSTANFFEHTYRMTAATSAINPSTITALKIKSIIFLYIRLSIILEWKRRISQPSCL